MRSLKILVFSFLMLLLFIPALQQALGLFSLKPVVGYFRNSPIPGFRNLNKSSWLSSVFQEALTKGIQDNIGMRPLLFRISNQFDLSVFGKVSAKGFLKGKDGCYFQEEYILEYCGRLFIGNKAISRKLWKLKDAQDSLQAHGISLLPVLEPGKASYFPEFIPDRYFTRGLRVSNYDLISRGMAWFGIRHLDMNRWLLLIKDTSRYPLFQPYGMHWSVYGEYLCADTLLKAAASVLGTRMPRLFCSKVRMSESLWATDYDIGDHLNLLWNLPAIELAYPVLSIDRSGCDTSARVLVIADSYYRTMLDDMPGPLFPNSEFWYYNSKLYPYIDEFTNAVKIDKSRLLEKLSGFRLILLMSSEINLHSFYWSFMDEVYAAFHPEFRETREFDMENSLRNDYNWFFEVYARSKRHGRPLELQVRDEAAWQARQ